MDLGILVFSFNLSSQMDEHTSNLYTWRQRRVRHSVNWPYDILPLKLLSVYDLHLNTS